MKVFYTAFVPLWAKFMLYVVVIFGCILFFALNIYLGVIGSICIILFSWLAMNGIRKKEKWIKSTMENDPFIQQNGFVLGSVSNYAMLMVSTQNVRIIVHNTRVNMNNTSYDISEIYKNYPRQGTDIVLNGINVYHLDIPISEIQFVNTLLNQDVTDMPFVGKLNFGIRIQTKRGVIYDVDTRMSAAFCAEINNQLAKSEKSEKIEDIVSAQLISSDSETDVDKVVKLEKIDNKKQDRHIFKLIMKIIALAIIIPIGSLIFLLVMNEIAKNIHWITSIGITFLGVIFYFFGNKLKKTDSFFISENNGVITLSSPLYIDLISIFGGVLILTGLFLNSSLINSIVEFKDESSSFRKNGLMLKVTIGFMALFIYYRAYRKLRYALFDKIVISKNQILIDDPSSKKSILLEKNEVIKIIDLKMRNDKKDLGRILEFHELKGGTHKIHEFNEAYFNKLSLSYQWFIDSLNKVGYKIQKEIKVESQDVRYNEDGSQVVTNSPN